jgi:hypothetical protein
LKDILRDRNEDERTDLQETNTVDDAEGLDPDTSEQTSPHMEPDKEQEDPVSENIEEENTEERPTEPRLEIGNLDAHPEPSSSVVMVIFYNRFH